MRYVAAMSTDDGIPEEGTEPQERVGHEECDATEGQCEIERGEYDGPPEECDFSPREETIDAMPIEEIPVIRDPKDGLPRPVDRKIEEAIAPPFTYDRVICIEDARKYVELFEDEAVLLPALSSYRTQSKRNRHVRDRVHDADFGYAWVSYQWDREHRQTPTGKLAATPDAVFYTQARWDEDGAERQRESWSPEDVTELWGVKCVKIAQGSYRPVRPVRPACRYFKRQCFNMDGMLDPFEPGARDNVMHCTMRRSIGGAFMALMGQNVYACDYRDPPDPESVAVHLDPFDRRRADGRPDKEKVSLFGIGGDDLVKEE